MTKFILLAARRSGTSLLIDCLNSHPDIACVKRAFGLEKKIKNPTPDEHSGGFYMHRTKKVGNRVRYYTNRYGQIDEFLAEDVFGLNVAEKAAGFRLIYEMSSRYPQVAEWAGNNGARVIHLIRGNCLKTYISAVSARIHKMRHPREGDRVKAVKIHIDPKQLVMELNKRTNEVQQQKKRFSGCPCHEVYYEDFIVNRDEESRRLLGFLDVEDTTSLSSDLVKINPDSLGDVIENYEEVYAVLRGTPYEKYLT